MVADSAAHPHSSCMAVCWRALDAAVDCTLTQCRSSVHKQATRHLASELLHLRVPMSTAQLVSLQVVVAAPACPLHNVHVKITL